MATGSESPGSGKGMVLVVGALLALAGGFGLYAFSLLSKESELALRLATAEHQLAPLLAAARKAFPSEEPAVAVAKFSERLDSCATTAPAPVTLSAKRTIAPELRQAMIDVLRGEAENRRTVWLEVNLSNPATAAFHGALSGIFKEAGWQVETRTIPGIALKPGVFLTIAEEEPPAWVGTVQQALDASGLEVKSARGYRAFYEAQKTSNPAWSGVRMSPEQQFALIIGPDPG